MSNTKITPLGDRPAFPFITTETFVEGHLGLTKREWLAGQALAGMGATFGVPAISVAEQAVKLADAVLEELAKEKI